MDWLVTGLSLIVLCATGIGFLRHEAWWIRAFDFPKAQLLVAAVALVLIHIFILGLQTWIDQLTVIALTISAVYLAICVVPYTALWPCQLKSAVSFDEPNTFSILSANVLTPNRNAHGLISLIRSVDPDIVLTIETDDWWERQLHALEADYPYSVRYPLDNLYGMHLYSRLRLIQSDVKFLVEEDKPSIHTLVELRSGQRFQLHCLHPAPPTPTENSTSQERDAELVIVAKSIKKQSLPSVVVGDLNDVAWSATTRLFQKISGLLDPRIGRGMFNTFHARYPLFRWPLDHVFCSSDFTLQSLKREAFFGSDHFPINAVLQYTPGAGIMHDEPEANGEDRAWAEAKIDNVPGAPRQTI